MQYNTNNINSVKIYNNQGYVTSNPQIDTNTEYNSENENNNANTNSINRCGKLKTPLLIIGGTVIIAIVIIVVVLIARGKKEDEKRIIEKGENVLLIQVNILLLKLIEQ